MNEKLFRQAVILALRYLLKAQNTVRIGVGGEWQCQSCGAWSKSLPPRENVDMVSGREIEHRPDCEWAKAVKCLDVAAGTPEKGER